MSIFGDHKNSNKFYIINSKGSIEWVPSLQLAQENINNPKLTEWYKKDIYCTSEKLVINSLGKVVLESQIKKDIPINDDTNLLNTYKLNFIENGEKYIDKALLTYSNKLGYTNFYTLISWINSSNKKFKSEAKKALLYRDTLYNYFHEFVNTYIKNKTTLDFTEEFTNFLNDFPKEDIKDND